MSESYLLPPHFGLLAVDVKDSMQLRAVQQAPLSAALVEVVDKGLEAAGLREMRREFENNTGDGLAFGFDPKWLSLVISPFMDVLNALLLERNAGAGPCIRLRMSVHCGPVPVASGLPGDGNATPRGETHRLLDSQPARKGLAMTDKNATPLVVIISDYVYRTVVLGGYCALPGSRFTEVQADVPGKGFTQTAWMYVPSPSGGLLRGTAGRPAPAKEDQAEVGHAVPVELPSGSTCTQYVELGIAVMNSSVHDVHHYSAPRQAPDGS
ncbi:hypothetical protein [Streptomyces sp. NPDC059788]|uniref:hypothetical protein n=1 Tax=Streptomyces sp. NPDC059788 TaxID=3346948 RepID=UPI00365E7098